MAVWTGICIFLVVTLFTQPSPPVIAGCIVFVTSWFGGGLAWLLMCFGREELILDNKAMHLRRTALITFVDRRIWWMDIREIKVVREENEEGWSYKLRVRTTGRPVELAAVWSRREAAAIVPLLTEHIQRARADEGDQDSAALPKTRRVERLSEHSGAWRRSDDSEFHVETRLGGRVLVRYVHRVGALRMIAVAWLFCSIWNTVLTMLIVDLIGNFRWGLALVLSAFVLIGLGFAAFLVVSLALPLLKERLSINATGITQNLSILGIGKQRSCARRDLDRLELRHARQKRLKREFQLALVGRDADLLLLKNLTEADARWIAHEILAGA